MSNEDENKKIEEMVRGEQGRQGLVQKLFRDQFGTACACIRDTDGAMETYAVRSEELKNAIIRAEVNKGNWLNQSELKERIAFFAAFAEKNEQIPMHLRVAESAGRIYYNLADPLRQVVEITPSAWKVSTEAPILFRNYPVTGAQVVPVNAEGFTLSKLFEWVNIQDPLVRVLFEVYLVSCFLPNIAHPMAAFSGNQGSAKTTTAKILKRLIDPSAVEVSPFPKSEAEIAQLCSHHHLIGLDNLTKIKPQCSDLLCQVVTGGTYVKRALYTDQKDVVMQLKGCIVLNGINMVVERPDLLDRTLLFPLSRITEDRRKDEQTIWQEFDACRPAILGSIFNTVSKALELLPGIHPDKSPRLADFYRAGIAISQALGYTHNEFETAIDLNSKNLQRAAIDGEPLIEAIVSFMQRKSAWEGTATMLLQELQRVQGSHSLPKASNHLSKRLKEIDLNLHEAGIHVDWGRDTNTNLTRINFTKV